MFKELVNSFHLARINDPKCEDTLPPPSEVRMLLIGLQLYVKMKMEKLAEKPGKPCLNDERLIFLYACRQVGLDRIQAILNAAEKPSAVQQQIVALRTDIETLLRAHGKVIS
ncbi:hypothetical protein HYZ99_05185 [Candidatus Peregrinibacteria bacterium]|nr:hypothetical protein [Candidatus Peregrinibacteria bacterium]